MTPDLHFTQVDIATIGASTAEDRYLMPPGLDGEWYLETADYMPATADAADASNYTTLTLKNGSTSLGTVSNATVAFVAGTVRAFTLSGGKSREFTGRADPVTLNKAETGTGGILDGAISLGWRKVS